MKMFRIRVNGNEYEVEVEEINKAADSVPTRSVQPQAETQPVMPAARKPVAPAASATPAQNGAETVQAPMPGTIVDILVSSGDRVSKGQTLMILEAMKMENEILAPHDCAVNQVHVDKGSSVNAGDLLITLS